MYVFMYVCLCKSPSAVLFTLQLLKHSSNRLRITMIRCKRLKVEGDKLKLDRLTDLPINVKHQIQEHLSIEDAAKMSVLSRPWRHVWASIPKLEFSAQFCRSKPPDTLVDVINTILSQHVGAIKTFLLNISSIPSSQHHVIDQWMLLLSRNGVVDLTLQNLHNAPYKLPSYMYSVELESLNLSNCIFRPPCNFRGFCKLKMLTLLEVAIEFDVSTSCLWMMPNLFSLKVRLCGGLPKIYAPELLHIFFFTRSPKTLMLDHFMDCRKLKTVILAKPEKNQDKPMNLTYLLNCWPMIKRLSLDGYYLKSFVYGTEEERLPTCLNRLKALSLFNFNFNDEDRLFSLLRLFGSSPNLEYLLLLLTWNKKGGMEVNVNHFERPAYRTLGLNKLQKFKIENFRGSRTEMLFVRFILASAPLLQEAILLEDAERVHESQCSEILKEVRGFPQASPKLKIICKPSKMAKEVVY